MIDKYDRHASSTEPGSSISNDATGTTAQRKRKRSEEPTAKSSEQVGLNGFSSKSTAALVIARKDDSVLGLDNEEEEIQRRRALRAQIQAKYSQAACEGTAFKNDNSLPSSTILHKDIANLQVNGQTAEVAYAHDFELTRNVDERQEIVPDGEPSAAEYDPDQDRILEHERNRERSLKQLADTESKLGETQYESDEDDMFASPDNGDAQGHNASTTAKKLDASMLDSWADTEGYYRIMIGELLDNRYAVQSVLGKGVFSAVVKCIDQIHGETVAIKVIRNNDAMRNTGLKEVELLEVLMAADADDRKHVIRLKRTFEHRNHLCLVFESLSLNLREVLKKFGGGVGINLKAVRAYAQQIFLALSLMRKCKIMHADLKPDNILVSESRSMLKVCDLGSASLVSENAPTPYLASRFYRAPEIILGLPYDTAMDVWAVGCTLYELYSGKILFPGRSNNQMLRLFMECRGRFPQKLLRKALFAGSHFDDEYNFNSVELDKVTGEQVTRVLNIVKPIQDLRTRLLSAITPEERPTVLKFVDFLERCLELESSKRLTPDEALRHPFIKRAS